MKLLDLMTGPWAILPETLVELQSVYVAHLRGEKIDIAAVENRLGRPLANEQPSYEIRAGGVAVLAAEGVMAPKANLMLQISGGISTQMLTRQLDALAADTRVRSVVFAADSPGGSVLGVPAAVKAMRRLAAKKPTVSVSEGKMASAMYWLGSAANAVYIDGETDMLGSIGVVQRLSWDAAPPNSLELVRGKYKRLSVNGQPPSAEVLAHQGAQLDYLYTLLVDAVAEHRGVTGAHALEYMADGRVFIGQQAIKAGLSDGIATVEEMVDRLAKDPEPYRKRQRVVTPSPALRVAGAAPAAAAPGDPWRRTRRGQADAARELAASKGIGFVEACKVLGIEAIDSLAAIPQTAPVPAAAVLTAQDRADLATQARHLAARERIGIAEAFKRLGVTHC